MSVWLSGMGGGGGLNPDGSVPLTAPWDAGAFKITASEFESRNGTTATQIIVNKMWLGVSDYERLKITGNSIVVESSGTGVPDIDLTLTPKGSGGVGIGTSSVLKRLHVKGTNDNVALFDNDGSQWTTLYFGNNGVPKATLAWDNNGSGLQLLAQAAGSILQLGAGNAEHMRITAAGGVILYNLPTSDPVVAGQLWNNLGIINVSAG